MLAAHALSQNFDLTYSLAGATSNPRTPASVAVRVGGFGGTQGLRQYCEQESIDAILDCTHPLPLACQNRLWPADGSVFRLERPAWTRMRGDRWIDVPHMNAARMRLQHVTGPIALALGKGARD